jgi:putative lipoprotein
MDMAGEARVSAAVGALLSLIVAGCGPYHGTLPSRAAVTGSVTYRERSALPPDAVVRVQLSDVSRQDAAAIPVAQTTVTPAGRQVPLPFELRYDAEAIDSTHTYAVRATIESGGRLIFTTTTASTVITRGRPTHVDLVLARVPDRTPAPPPPPGGLVGTRWTLEDLAGAGVIDEAMATLEFPEPGKVAGSGSCNRFFGTVSIEGNAIAIGPLGSTRMACAEVVAMQEVNYIRALQNAERYVLQGTALLIYVRGMQSPLRFIRGR